MTDEHGLRGLRSPASHGQSTIEYAVLMAIIVAALVAMQIYVKRGFSGRLRAAADSVGEQYSPRHTTSTDTQLTVVSNTTTTSQLARNQDLGDGSRGAVMVTTTTINRVDRGHGRPEGDTTTRTGTETVEALGTETLWER